MHKLIPKLLKDLVVTPVLELWSLWTLLCETRERKGKTKKAIPCKSCGPRSGAFAQKSQTGNTQLLQPLKSGRCSPREADFSRHQGPHQEFLPLPLGAAGAAIVGPAGVVVSSLAIATSGSGSTGFPWYVQAAGSPTSCCVAPHFVQYSSQENAMWSTSTMLSSNGKGA